MITTDTDLLDTIQQRQPQTDHASAWWWVALLGLLWVLLT